MTFNQAFHEVIFACALAPNRRGPQGEKSAMTWITEAMIEAYIDLHYAGHAYSVEAWRDGEPEPAGWDVDSREGGPVVPEGGALLVAHNTDVTFGRLTATPNAPDEP